MILGFDQGYTGQVGSNGFALSSPHGALANCGSDGRLAIVRISLTLNPGYGLIF